MNNDFGPNSNNIRSEESKDNNNIITAAEFEAIALSGDVVANKKQQNEEMNLFAAHRAFTNKTY